MAHFRDLIVWQRSLSLAKRIYAITDQFPTDQRFSLSDQMQRAAVSVMSNIAEGSKRAKKDCCYFFRIAHGSAAELEAQMVLCFEMKYLEKDVADLIFDDLNQIQRMLHVLIHNGS